VDDEQPGRKAAQQRTEHELPMNDTTQPAGGPGGKQIKVFLMDDHEIVRRGVREMLEGEPDITVIGEAGTAASALARIPALAPDVAVLDVRPCPASPA
jgi:PleD family two-component response regulator